MERDMRRGQKDRSWEGLEWSWPGLHLYESSVVCLPPRTVSSSEGRNLSCLRTQPLCIPEAELLPGSQLALISVSGTNG